MSGQENERAGTKRIVKRLVIVTLAMFGFGYALVPLYSVFCDITGINGRAVGVADATATNQIDEQRMVTVEFMASVNDSLNWEFRPQQFQIKVHPGEPTTVNYYAKNLGRHAVTGQAVPSVAPGIASLHFDKVECFCFTEQELEAGEGRDMPVTFVVDPELPDSVPRLTLSYTFYSAGGPAANEHQHVHVHEEPAS